MANDVIVVEVHFGHFLRWHLLYSIHANMTAVILSPYTSGANTLSHVTPAHTNSLRDVILCMALVFVLLDLSAMLAVE